MPTIQRFEDLRIWLESRELVQQVYQLTAKLPRQESFGLSSQMRRAAVSVMSNIAEGFERGSNTEFIQFLFIARSSSGELRSQCYVASDLKYGTEAEIQNIRDRCERLSRRIQALVEYLKSSEIKGQKFHETKAIYEIQEPET